MRLRVLMALVVLRHPWRSGRAWGRKVGVVRTSQTYYCPGCGYRSRRWPRVTEHSKGQGVDCSQDRKATRRLERAARKGAVSV